jgi:shikimate kinase
MREPAIAAERPNSAVNRVLITGTSGAGKSSVIQELAARGYRAIDLDTPEWSRWVDADPADRFTPAEGKDWIWREDRVRALLLETSEGILFVSGCSENMGRLLPLVDLVILLSAPTEAVMARLKARSSGSYGHTDQERAKVAHLISAIEPVLRRMADHEIKTTRPVRETAEEVLKLTARRAQRDHEQ